MRRANQNVYFIEKDETFLGVSLGFDFVAEHEWGFDGIKRKFGLNDSLPGMDRMSITSNKGVYLLESEGSALLTTRNRSNDLKMSLPYDMAYLYGTSIELGIAWDSDDFSIFTTTEKGVKYLNELYNAFKDNNVIIGFIIDVNDEHHAKSLSIYIKSKLPQEYIDTINYVETKRLNLIKYESEIGVTKLKENARKKSGYKGIHYFLACSPTWIEYDDPEKLKVRKEEMGTNYDIMFWVNYSDDDDNYGYYTAEEIIKWLSTPGLKLTQIRKAK